ncbi:GPN-loop GTPase 3 [Neolecta irregularis DAH-3]|uniref:GPN-loop GTPase 3 n=1 Tax=Neolecta irregularis (strain DAH-3) TaxID=1198029 RepID=A0A1U7LTH8_NEOID|nr:GPN-loop GTPase 3 [Neolecta irregularis DAH-3]|eukprot:OLL25821.1 GPN-loop GTPase 3 [Neolecta irregularis DAH-3]
MGTHNRRPDIRDLISLEDVMEEMDFGPNGGLIYCFEFLMQNLDWLDEELGEHEDDYLIFDMPGQIELYTHIPVLPSLINHLKLNLHFRLCAAYLLESPFLVDKTKYFAGVMSAMSAMIMMEIPHINIMSKMDLIKGQIKKRELKRYLDPDPLLLADEINSKTNPKFHSLNEAIVQLIDDFNMVSFLPLESGNEESVAAILSYVDDATQWAEDQEPKEPKDEELEGSEEVEI